MAAECQVRMVRHRDNDRGRTLGVGYRRRSQHRPGTAQQADLEYATWGKAGHGGHDRCPRGTRDGIKPDLRSHSFDPLRTLQLRGAVNRHDTRRGTLHPESMLQPGGGGHRDVGAMPTRPTAGSGSLSRVR